MFSLIRGLYDYVFSPPSVKVALFGLDNAGKSSLAEQFSSMAKGKQAFARHIPPTTGLTIVKVAFEGRLWTLWDLGGSQTMRQIWSHYARSTDTIIFVVDGKDESRLNEAKEAFFSVLNYYTEGTIPPILIAINKFDSPDEVVPESLLKTIQSWISSVHNAGTNISDPYTGIMMAKISCRTGNGLIDAMAQLDTAFAFSTHI